MAYIVAIIGSFQKYYQEICEVIKILKENNLYVISPSGAKITGKIDDFVIFKTDCSAYTPAEIQMITLEKIMKADAVYVYNPNGYIGKTTSYEIGFCFSRKKPVYFYKPPQDLPIPINDEKQIVSPLELSEILANKKQRFILDYGLSSEANQSLLNLCDIKIPSKTAYRIVICGSMIFYKEMLLCQNELLRMGVKSIIPKDEDDIIYRLTEQEFLAFKRKVSNSYLRKIRDKSTIGVLIYNAEKHGEENYIGANTLVELAMAFSWNRRIFLYNDIYEPIKDELQAWNAICLNGNLLSIKEYLNPMVYDNTDEFEQLSFWE